MSVSPVQTKYNKSVNGGPRVFREDHVPWLTALKTDDVDTIRRLLDEADEEEQELLLEGWIDIDVFWLDLDECITDKEAYAIRRSFPLAASCGSLGVLDELIKRGINICQTDDIGNNVVHSLVIFASLHQSVEEREVEVYQYLKSKLPSYEMESLILAENTDGLRPVELAGLYQTLRMVEAIYNTQGHYLYKSQTCGMMSIMHYHIDEYEGILPTRTVHKSPMKFLVHLGGKKLDDDYTKHFFTKGLFADWMKCRRKSFAWVIVVWLLIRLFVICMAFLAAALTSPAATASITCGYDPGLSDEGRMVCTLLLLVFAVMGLVLDVWDAVNIAVNLPAAHKRYMAKQGTMIARFSNYRIAQALFNTSIVVLCINKICGHYMDSSMPPYCTEVFIVTFTICTIWSLLYFGQLLGSLGNYITATQLMINSLLYFGALIMLFVFPFTFTFGHLAVPGENSTCPDEFSSVASALYSAFEISQGMQDIRAYASPSKEGLWLAHVAYVILVVILLLNFLISIFTDAYVAVAANPEIIFELQWLSVLAIIDYRVPNCVRPLLHRVKKRYFAVVGSQEAIAVKTFETRKA